MVAPEGTLSVFLLLGASVAAGYLGHLLFERFRISDILVLLLVGFLLGPIAGLIDPSVMAGALPVLAPLGLAVVLFEGGLDLSFRDIKQSGRRALAMTLAVWTITTLSVAIVAHLIFGIAPIVAVLFGTAVAATGILGVVPLLTAIRAPAQARTLLTVETSLGDLLSAVVTTTLAGVLVLGLSPWVGVSLFALKFVVGAGVGAIAGLAWSRALHALDGHRHAFALTLGTLLVTYAAAEVLMGSGFLMALAFGLVVGNAHVLARAMGVRSLASVPPSMRLHQSELIFVLRSFYFVFIGMSVARDTLAPAMLLGGAALVLTMLAARALAVWGTTADDVTIDAPSRLLLASMMPRGLATAVIAGIPVAMGVPGTERFLGLTFLVILGADIATSAGLWAYRKQRDAVAAGAANEAPA